MSNSPAVAKVPTNNSQKKVPFGGKNVAATGQLISSPFYQFLCVSPFFYCISNIFTAFWNANGNYFAPPICLSSHLLPPFALCHHHISGSKTEPSLPSCLFPDFSFFLYISPFSIFSYSRADGRQATKFF